MKKRIKDLKLNDTVFKSSGGEVTEHQVYSISNNLLVLRQNGSKYYEHKFEMTKEDLTRFQFVAKDTFKYDFFLSRIDALKDARKYLDKNLESVFEKQQDFLRRVQEANNSIREMDAIIAKELKINN